MKTVLFTGLALLASPALAGPLDGTWKGDLKTATFTSPPDIYSLSGGRYACPSCKPPVAIPADGAFHHIAGADYYDEVAVKIVDARTARLVQRKGGKQTYQETDTVSPDGRLLTQTFIDTSGSKPVSGVATETRIGAAARGAHPLSGHWNPKPASQVSDAGMIVTIRTTADAITVTTPTGQSYTARFGGPAVPIQGDIGHAMVRVTRRGTNGFQAVSLHDGKVTAAVTAVANGRTMTYSVQSFKYGTRTTMKAYRQ